MQRAERLELEKPEGFRGRSGERDEEMHPGSLPHTAVTPGGGGPGALPGPCPGSGSRSEGRPGAPRRPHPCPAGSRGGPEHSENPRGLRAGPRGLPGPALRRTGS